MTPRKRNAGDRIVDWRTYSNSLPVIRVSSTSQAIDVNILACEFCLVAIVLHSARLPLRHAARGVRTPRLRPSAKFVNVDVGSKHAVGRRGPIPAVLTPALQAGGFQWDDPTESFDQGVENPFKNPGLTSSEEGMKIDPARLLSPRLSGSNLYLIGMMGTGKSSVGNIVARRMGTYSFLDTDDIIEKATGMKIPEIFASEGEDAFRKVEAQILDSVHPYVRCVISTGGGIVCRRENWSKLHTGIVVWLDCDPDVIMSRIRGTDRPLLQTPDPLQTLKDLLDERRDQYSQADLRIEVTADMDEQSVADTIVRGLHDFIDNNPPAWKMAKAKAQADGLDWVQ